MSVPWLVLLPVKQFIIFVVNMEALLASFGLMDDKFSTELINVLVFSGTLAHTAMWPDNNIAKEMSLRIDFSMDKM